MTTESLTVEYRHVYAQMKGISSKVSTYKALEQRLNEIKVLLGNQDVEGVGKFLGRKNNRIVKIKKGIDPVIAEEKKTFCNVPGCGKPRAHRGRGSTGVIKLRSRCNSHWKHRNDKIEQVEHN